MNKIQGKLHQALLVLFFVIYAIPNANATTFSFANIVNGVSHTDTVDGITITLDNPINSGSTAGVFTNYISSSFAFGVWSGLSADLVSFRVTFDTTVNLDTIGYRGNPGNLPPFSIIGTGVNSLNNPGGNSVNVPPVGAPLTFQANTPYTFLLTPTPANNNAATIASFVVTTPDDGDGVDDAVESAVPDADGSGTGDGNNDGTPDTDQSHVSSLKTHDTNNYITVDNTDDLNLTAVSASAAPADLPAGVTFPYDMVSFTVNGVGNGATVTMDIFYPYNPAINGFWKKGNDGNWSDVSTSISHVGTTKTKITISLVEGGNFDTDGAGNGTLTDPGGAGVGAAAATAIPTLSEWMLILLAMILGFFAALKMKGHREM